MAGCAILVRLVAILRGTRIGVFEVQDLIGSGGMGEVYSASDTTLGRQVAIKILPDALAADPDRLARFEREARTLASLNHPHIAAVYGFEHWADAVPRRAALVMELVEGPTLARRIAEGPLPLDEVLPISRQIAEAIEAAHAQGIARSAWRMRRMRGWRSKTRSRRRSVLPSRRHLPAGSYGR